MPVSVPATLDVQGAQEVTPKRAPVAPPLSGREKAGVYLTWGVMATIALFLVAVMGLLWWQESAVQAALAPAGQGAATDTARFRMLAAERSAFRAFWLDMVQVVLVNVLLPVLTALLGYVFGTQARNAAPEQ